MTRVAKTSEPATSAAWKESLETLIEALEAYISGDYEKFDKLFCGSGPLPEAFASQVIEIFFDEFLPEAYKRAPIRKLEKAWENRPYQTAPWGNVLWFGDVALRYCKRAEEFFWSDEFARLSAVWKQAWGEYLRRAYGMY